MGSINIGRLLGSPEGRKGIAYAQALIVLVLLGVAAFVDGGMSENELDSLLMALTGILATFSGTNVGEHFAKRPRAAIAPAVEEDTATQP